MAGHYYCADGSPCFEVPNKSKGGMRPVTIRDCRKLNLLPSVTTVLSDVLVKDDLSDWKLREMAKAAHSNPAKSMEAVEQYQARLEDVAFKQVRDAADIGTNVHKALELYFQDKPYDTKWASYVTPAAKYIRDNEIYFVKQELRLVNHAHGYAGTTDGVFSSPQGTGIWDWKTKRTSAAYKIEPWEDHPTQIAAYHMAHFGCIEDGHIGANAYLSTTEPGRFEVIYYDAATLRAHWEMFQHVLAIWRFRKGYDPRQLKAAA
jgi:hypothetical protein